MKTCWSYALLLVMIGCTEITYRQPQPKAVQALKTIPKELQGRYLLPDDNRATPDTLVVEANAYYALSEKNDRRVLGDSVVLKYYKGYYFINLREKPEWLLRVIRREKDGSLSYFMLGAEDKNFPAFVKQLAAEIPVDSSEVNGKKLYQIDPSPKQLMGLIKNKYFQQTTTLTRVP